MPNWAIVVQFRHRIDIADTPFRSKPSVGPRWLEKGSPAFRPFGLPHVCAPSNMFDMGQEVVAKFLFPSAEVCS